jgi:hypothetical protein
VKPGARLALLAALGLVAVSAPAAIAYDAVHKTGVHTGQHAAHGPLSAPFAGEKGGPGAAEQPSSSAAPPATPKDPFSRRIADALKQQADALLTGDAAGFTASAAPADTGLRADLGRRFGSLRAMKVAVWKEELDKQPGKDADGSTTVQVRITYCFVVPDCAPLRVPIATRWVDANGTPTLVAFGTSSGDDLGPRPWEVSDLRAAVGPRVLVATVPKYANRLQAVLNAAEKAAATTDRFARWGRPPGRYVVLLAGADEWAKWYGMRQQAWVAAIAMPLTDVSTEVVLNVSNVDNRDVTDVLRHELTHVVTLSGVDRTYDHSWWLVEGIAEYVRVTGSNRPFDGMGDARRYLHSGRWDGDVAMDGPPSDATDNDVNGRYAVAYLAVKRLSDRFGENTMLDFFAAVAREGKSLQEASSTVLGTPWSDVFSDCAQFVRTKAA